MSHTENLNEAADILLNLSINDLGNIFLVMLSQKLKIIYPIILVISDLMASVIIPFPIVEIQSDLIFDLILPT